MSWRSVSTWTSCASSLHVTSPNFSFKSEHSLQALVVVAVVVCSLYSTLVPRSLDFDSHRGVETHASLGAHIPISVHPSSFVLLSTATRTQPARELSDAQLGTPNRVLRRSRMSSYSLPLPASVAITRNSFGSDWTSSRYSAQPPAPNPHETSPMHSLVLPIGSCEGPA